MITKACGLLRRKGILQGVKRIHGHSFPSKATVYRWVDLSKDGESSVEELRPVGRQNLPCLLGTLLLWKPQ